MNIRQMPVEVLTSRLADVNNEIAKVEERMRKPPAFAHYDPRNDLSLNTELHKYLREIKEELKRRTPLSA